MRHRCVILTMTLAVAVAWGEPDGGCSTFQAPAAVHLRLSPVQADDVTAEPGASFERDLADMLSDYGCVVPGVAAGALLASDDPAQRHIGELAAWSIAYTTAATHLLKATIRSPRPNRPEVTNGFPSGHASMTFAFARCVAEEDREWGAVACAWAAGVAWSRVRRGDHDLPQVLAGAALGWWIADQVARNRRPVPATGPPADARVMLRW